MRKPAPGDLETLPVTSSVWLFHRGGRQDAFTEAPQPERSAQLPAVNPKRDARTTGATRPCSTALTLLKLDPHSSIILDLLDHLPTPADDHSHRVPGHRYLRDGAEGQLAPRSTAQPTRGGLHSHRCPRQFGIHTRSGPQSCSGHAPGGCPSPSRRLAANTQHVCMPGTVTPASPAARGPGPGLRTDTRV